MYKIEHWFPATGNKKKFFLQFTIDSLVIIPNSIINFKEIRHTRWVLEVKKIK